jgi:uncharacterized protein with FMN-binding domain
MKKGLVIIFAVAIIGGLGAYTKAHNKTANTGVSAVQGAETTMLDPNNSTQPTGPAETASITYKDGTYTGDNESTIYGDVQIAVIVSGGKITEVNFLRMPGGEGHTNEVTAFSKPLLKQQTLKNQSANIDFVTGATQTSEGYEQSLQSALDQAV